MSDPLRILGVDPGSQVTGFGVIEQRGAAYDYVASGCIRLKGETLGERLQTLFVGMTEVIETHRPALMAVERVFVRRNADSALKLGQARGAAICAAALRPLTVYEYAPAEIKKAVAGTGRATKEQIQHMVKVLLKLRGDLAEDAADALACALCHSHVSRTRARMEQAASSLGAGKKGTAPFFEGL